MANSACGAGEIDPARASLHAASLVGAAAAGAEQDFGPELLRLANALPALYLGGSQEKRLLDAMLVAAPR